jgi:activator of HSP90 ATPase
VQETDARNRSSSLPDGNTSRRVILGAIVGLGGTAVSSPLVWSADANGLSQTAEVIHQRPVFQASRQRVYEALTDERQFDAWMRRSGAMRSMATGTSPATISREPGGAFSLFGGYVTGRQLDLVPNERIVQAWRSQGWEDGEYSIVRFDFAEEGPATRIIFEHRGFPAGTGAHLATGWEQNYWAPLREYLSQHK